MDALCQTQWWIFKWESSKFPCCKACSCLSFLLTHPRQRNVDYSKTRALSFGTLGLPRALDIYDINCQYCKNFWTRIAKRPEWLDLPENINEKTLVFAVGSFHLSAHVPACFSEFSLHFVKEIGHIDGEILETLWAAFNNISPMCRPMTASQRREIYDDFMRDSNWKKMTNIGLSPIWH